MYTYSKHTILIQSRLSLSLYQLNCKFTKIGNGYKYKCTIFIVDKYVAFPIESTYKIPYIHENL